jgi:NAD(P)-dependent dehydrogenase (short-subunit alcohol dehydrogenase family)
MINAADARHGVRVNWFVSGAVETLLNRGPIGDPKRRAKLVAGEPIGRLATPEDMLAIAVFLASEESAFATELPRVAARRRDSWRPGRTMVAPLLAKGFRCMIY